MLAAAVRSMTMRFDVFMNPANTRRLQTIKSFLTWNARKYMNSIFNDLAFTGNAGHKPQLHNIKLMIYLLNSYQLAHWMNVI